MNQEKTEIQAHVKIGIYTHFGSDFHRCVTIPDKE
jgi:hypothetical protein